MTARTSSAPAESFHALIIANGFLPSDSRVRRLRATADVVVCADGGANRARGVGIKPDIILGDLDSLSLATRRFYKDTPIFEIPDQESTDLEKAILFCIALGAASADILGALGGRIDHITGSLGCFKRFGKKIELRFIDQYGELSRIQNSVRLKTRRGQKISLIPLDRCTGVTTRNLKYPLRNDILETGVREGISNEATGGFATISLKRGTLLLFRFSNARR
jgi:thiamine pyrophosphokinase